MLRRVEAVTLTNYGQGAKLLAQALLLTGLDDPAVAAQIVKKMIVEAQQGAYKDAHGLRGAVSQLYDAMQ